MTPIRLLLSLAALALITGGAAARPAPETFRFERAVGNVEYARRWLSLSAPVTVGKVPPVAGTAWYGSIMRRLASDVAALRAEHFVPFLAEYDGGVAARLWCDADLDGDLSNQPPLRLAVYPEGEGARSALVDLRWKSSIDGREAPIEWTVRVVLDPLPDGPPAGVQVPGYRLQMVHAMMGTVSIEGGPHRAFLMDGNGDGFYTRDSFDGLFVDLDDDGHVEVDQMSPDFGPFGIPFTMGRTSYEVLSVDPQGRELTLRPIGPSPPVPPAPAVGEPAPDVTLQDTGGRTIRLSDLRGRTVVVYFWASWCPTCAGQAEGLREIYERLHPQGLEILAVSYDTEREAMERFRRDHGQTWPTSFSGRGAWEDPVGRIYRARDVCAFYVVDRSGRLEGIYSGLAHLEPRLSDLVAPSSESQRQSPAARKPPQKKG